MGTRLDGSDELRARLGMGVTLEELSSELRSMLHARSLFVRDDALQREVLWVATRALVRKHDRTAVNDLKLDVVEDALGHQDRIEQLLGASVPIARRYAFFGPEALREHVAELKRAGVSSIDPPWPESESSHGFLGHGFSVDEQLRRVSAVLDAALEAYPKLVDEWFPNLAHRMRIHVTLPAVLRGS